MYDIRFSKDNKVCVYRNDECIYVGRNVADAVRGVRMMRHSAQLPKEPRIISFVSLAQY